MTVDLRSIADKAPRPERHVPVVVVGAGVAGVAAAVAAARGGAQVLLVDEHPVDNAMMAMDVPLYFGQPIQESGRNRPPMMEAGVEGNPGSPQRTRAGGARRPGPNGGGA